MNRRIESGVGVDDRLNPLPKVVSSSPLCLTSRRRGQSQPLEDLFKLCAADGGVPRPVLRFRPWSSGSEITGSRSRWADTPAPVPTVTSHGHPTHHAMRDVIGRPVERLFRENPSFTPRRRSRIHLACGTTTTAGHPGRAGRPPRRHYPTTSPSELGQAYGSDNVVDTTFIVEEEELEPGTLVFPNDSSLTLKVFWRVVGADLADELSST